MPNTQRQITESDMKAPDGQFRIMQENMGDGELEIVADFRRQLTAETVTRRLQEENADDVFTLYDDQGNAIL